MEFIIILLVVLIVIKCVFSVGKYIISWLWCLYQSRKPVSYEVSNTSETYKISHDVNGKSKIKSGIVGFFDGCTRYSIKKAGSIPSFIVRNYLYKHVFRMNIKKGAIIYAGCEFRQPWNITIGKSTIGPNNILDGRKGLVIGDYVCTGSEAKIWTLQHDVQDSMFCTVGGSVKIGDYVWVASHSTVLPGRNIGKGAVVASGSIVTKDCEEYGIYAGVPCVKKGERNRELLYTMDVKPWFV